MSTYYIEKRQTLLADNTAHKGWYSRWYSSVKGQFSIRPKRIFSTLASKQLVPPSAKRSLDSIYGSAYPWLEINQRSDDMNIHIMGLNGQKKDINKQQFEQYTTSIRGDVLLPETAGYAEARTIWNGMIDISPSVIVRCSGAADVVTTIQFARKYELLISLKGGGHNIAGSALCNGGITLDLSSMKGISVDPSARIARVQSGVCLGDIDHETQRFGLAVPTGINSTTGIAGLALGGIWLVKSCFWAYR
ncbi:MAG: FAD-binding oxidoreductase [Paraglaciecola chathamensis]